MKYVLVLVGLLIFSVQVIANEQNTVNSESKSCMEELEDDLKKNTKSLTEGQKKLLIDKEKLIYLYDDASGGSDIGGRCSKVTLNVNDNKIIMRGTARTEELDRRFNFEYKVQLPLEIKDQMDVKDIDFDGLTNGIEFTVGFSYMKIKSGDGKFDSTDSSFYRFGTNLSLAIENFRYVNGNNIHDKYSERQTHNALSAYGVYYSNRFMLGASLTHEQAYKAGVKKNLCLEISAGVNQCADVIVGAPMESTTQFGIFDLRVPFKNQNVITGLTITHDIENSITKVDVPVYRLKESDETISAGFMVSWDSKTRETRASLLVGSTLDILGGRF